MNLELEAGWKALLDDEFKKPYFKALDAFVTQEYAKETVYPPASEIFSAFDQCPLANTKVVIIGQDPYHGEHQAHGLCFSVNEGVKIPPSLRNIYKEINLDLGYPPPTSGNLEHWAQQGVLLINATLTVRAHQAGSHQKKGWETFTDAVIQSLSDEKEGLVFFLWGAYAQKKGEVIDSNKHLILKSVHPSPLSASRGFFGNKHFSTCNQYLHSQDKTPIYWQKENTLFNSEFGI